MTYYIGQQPTELLGDSPRYFYGLRRTDDGEIYFVRIDQLKTDESIEINNIGDEAENFNEFELGIDFFEGRNVDHELVFENLKFEQFRWDNRPLYYYIDNDGQLVVRINQSYTYPTGI